MITLTISTKIYDTWDFHSHAGLIWYETVSSKFLQTTLRTVVSSPAGKKVPIGAKFDVCQPVVLSVLKISISKPSHKALISKILTNLM